ncbi:NAD(P)-dependent oxidoreductase [Shinella sp.]|uniref:NAD(P)-dependent oxidoreductase n=1 Tax=Shinella sp. TaxID=1870904 RepID=UPI0029A835DB|nr:NAD(P)-dependent oxidoreductase [Shinella sp.]MDX3977420.1 NAD(P)-dependent oxidoreductase [Shinella sp.]
MSKSAHIAFIGLGQMGMPMALNLLKAGYDVVGFDLSSEALQALAERGGRIAASAVDAMSGSDVIITMLSNGKIVQSVLLEGDAFRQAPKSALLLEMSSSAPEETRSLAAKVSGHLRVVDAPVSGGVKRAVEGSLALMAGGSEADFEAAKPILGAMSAKIFHCGPVGTGHAMKAINNYVSGAGVIAAVEAVLLGRAFGLDEAKVVDVLNSSSGKNNATEVKMNQFILSGTFGSGFALGLMAKDIRTAANLSTSLGLSQPGLTQTADLWDDAARTLGGAVDHTRFYDYLKRQGD